MKGILVVPQVALYGWSSYGKEGRRNNSLPHGALSIATEMNRAGHDVSILDMRQFPDLGAVLREITRRKPVFVGCGPMTVDFGIAKDLFHDLKVRLPHVTTVMGGVHASVCPKEAAACDDVDYVVTGEGEWTLTEMADAGFVGFDRVTEGRIPDLNALLPINRELVDYRNGELNHGGGWNSRMPYLTVMCGRGCPHKCAFCYPVSFTMFGPKCRMRSVEHVMWELDYCIKRYKPAFIDFIDDNFTMFPKWVEAFIEAWKKRGYTGIALNAASRVETALEHPEIFRGLREIGLESVNVGFESGCDRHLQFLGKGSTAAQNLEAGKFFKSLGLKIIANVIFGIPGETPAETMQTIQMCKDMEADYPSPAFFTPYPGCALHGEWKDKLLVKDYAKLSRHANEPKISGVDYAPIQALVRSELMK